MKPLIYICDINNYLTSVICEMLKLYDVELRILKKGETPVSRVFILVPWYSNQFVTPVKSSSIYDKLKNTGQIFRKQLLIKNRFITYCPYDCDPKDNKKLDEDMGLVVKSSIKGLVDALGQIPYDLEDSMVLSLSRPALVNEIRFLLHELRKEKEIDTTLNLLKRPDVISLLDENREITNKIIQPGYLVNILKRLLDKINGDI